MKTFSAWKKALLKLNPKFPKYRLPSDNILVLWYEQGKTPEQVLSHLIKQPAK